MTIAKHLKDADSWALWSFRLEKMRARQRTEHPDMSPAVDRANLLRIALSHIDARDIAAAPYRLRDTKKGTYSTSVTGRAQGILCNFCNKQVGAWPAFKKNHHRRFDAHWPEPMDRAIHVHIPSCARSFLRTTLSRWHTNQMKLVHEQAVQAWIKEYMKSRGDRDRSWNEIPKELDGIFDNLPEPPGHPLTQELEVMLIATSRLWETFPVIYGDESATRDMPHVVAMRKLPVPDRVMYKLVRRVGECHMLESPLCAGRLDHRPKCGCWLWSPSEGRWYR